MKKFAFLIMAALAMISYSCDSTLRLSREDEAFLQAIYSPEIVGVPLSDARKDLCEMKDGEIRAYGPKDSLYLSSTDYGLTWKKHRAEGRMLSAKWIAGSGSSSDRSFCSIVRKPYTAFVGVPSLVFSMRMP